MSKWIPWPTKVCVIGNGPDANEVVAPGLKIRFNRVSSDAVLLEDAPVLWINNQRHNGDTTGFISEGAYASTNLDANLQAKAHELSSVLGCWPSSGLTTVTLLAEKVQFLRVYKMPLLPSLLRPTGLHPRKPLACAFHNWLGERRLAFLSTASAGPWRSLFQDKPEGGSTVSGDLFQDLLSLHQISRNESRKLLNQLSQVSASCWISNTTPQLLKSAEHLFHLDRRSNQTRNWWLYDHDGSAQADAIRGRLAWCQQQVIGVRASAVP